MRGLIVLKIFLVFLGLNLSAATNYYIVANSGLQESASLQEFIEWKQLKGFQVITHFVDSAASVAEIDSWLEEQYENSSASAHYLLLIGDADGNYRVPTQEEGLPPGPGEIISDLVYGVVGEMNIYNRIPQIQVGRITVREPEELDTQLEKTIWYEKEQFLQGYDLSYLQNMLGESNARPEYADYRNAVIEYGWNNYFNDSTYNPFTEEINSFTGISYVYPHADTLELIENIKSDISAGVAFYYYLGNADAYKLKYPFFNISDLDDITNLNKYPVLFIGG